jgi:hypothetical protein
MVQHLAASEMAVIQLPALGMVAEGVLVWLASQAVLPAPVAVKQVRSSANLGFSAVASQMAASAVKMAKLARLLMVGAKVVSPDLEEGRGRSRCSHHSPAGVRLRFSFPRFFHRGRSGFR